MRPSSDVWLDLGFWRITNASSIMYSVWPPPSSLREDFRLWSRRETSPNQSITPVFSLDKNTLPLESKWSTSHHSWSVSPKSNSFKDPPPPSSELERMDVLRERRLPVVVVMMTSDHLWFPQTASKPLLEFRLSALREWLSISSQMNFVQSIDTLLESYAAHT